MNKETSHSVLKKLNEEYHQFRNQAALKFSALSIILFFAIVVGFYFLKWIAILPVILLFPFLVWALGIANAQKKIESIEQEVKDKVIVPKLYEHFENLIYTPNNYHNFDEVFSTYIFGDWFREKSYKGKDLITYNTPSYDLKISEIKMTGITFNFMLITATFKTGDFENDILIRPKRLSLGEKHNRGGSKHSLYFNKAKGQAYQISNEDFNKIYAQSSYTIVETNHFTEKFIPQLFEKLKKYKRPRSKYFLATNSNHLAILIHDYGLYKFNLGYRDDRKETEKRISFFSELKNELDEIPKYLNKK